MSKIEVDQIDKQSGSTLTVGGSGTAVTLASGATQTGFGRTGTVDWNTTPITSTPTTGVSGVGYFINSTAGVKTVNLPASPSAGDIMAVSDYAGTSDTNAITIGRNGSNINGAAADISIQLENSAVTLVYVDGTQGWKTTDTSSLSDIELQPAFIVATSPCVTTVGDYKIHRFTGPGDFVVCSAGNSLGSDKVDSLLVAGGGGGGANLAGGAGAGGVVLIESCNATAISAVSYPIVIGGAGAAGTPPSATGGNGSNTTGLSLTAIGGGGAGPASTGAAGTPGGSGGGAAGGSSASITNGGTATQPSQPGNSGTYGFGSAGGNRTPAGSAANGGGAGGGGGGAVGSNQPGGGTGGAGGVGKDATPIFGTSPQPFYGPTNGVYGGGGGAGGNSAAGGSGGSGGGAPGGSCGPGAAGSNATTNTGGGGGGGSGGDGAGGTGGSGVVLIRYKFQ